MRLLMRPLPDRLAIGLAVLVLLPATATAQTAVASDPAAATSEPMLFESHEPLELTIRANFDDLKGDRSQEEDDRPGSLTVTTAGGTTLDLSLQVKTRGRFRLQRSTCHMPPLRINLKKGELDDTFLDGQDKLKLVTHCRDHDRFEENVLEEYLIYRMFNTLTDNSFRVRLARITYVDTSGRDDPLTRYGFLIENDELMAERLGGELIELEEDDLVHPARITGANAALVTIFQYMIGNTDFSMFRGHNFKIVDTGETILPVPYDFDWSGFVNAPYARPDRNLGIRSVKQRLFRGLCRADVDYDHFYRLFREKRPEIEALVREQEGLSRNAAEDAVDYLAGFYDTIDDEKRARRSIQDACRGA